MSQTYNAGDLSRLRTQAFAHASQETVQSSGLEMIFERTLTHAEDVWLSESIQAYRLPESDNVALVWGLSDGAHNSGGFSTGLREIPREDYEALLKDLDALWPENIAWCAADAGLGKPRPQQRWEAPKDASANRQGDDGDRQKERASTYPWGLAALAAVCSALCALSPRLAPDESAQSTLFEGSLFVMIALIIVISVRKPKNKTKVAIDLLLTGALLALAFIGVR